MVFPFPIQMLCAITLVVGMPTGLRSEDSVDGFAKRIVAASLVYDEIEMETCRAGLTHIGQQALSRISPLLMHQDANVRWQAVLVANGIGVAAIGLDQQLTKCCRDDDADVRAAAILALQRLYPQLPATRKMVSHLAGDPHDLVRANAYYARWKLTEDKSVIQSLVALLGCRDWMVVDAAVSHLASISTEAVPGLLQVAQDARHPGALAAIRTLGAIHPTHPKTLTFLATAVVRQDPALSRAAAQALAELGEPAVDTVLTLTAADRTANTKLLAVRALARMGPATCNRARVIAALKRTLACSHPLIRQVSLAALCHAETLDDELLQQLAGLLHDPSPDIRAAAAASLAGKRGISPAAWESLRHLARHDNHDFVRRAARRTVNE